MTETVEARLQRLGVVLPTPAAPAANYLPFVVLDGVLYISGQLPMTSEGVAVRGKVGETVSVEDARKAARLCVINVLAQAKAALGGDLERVRQILRITCFVASSPGFSEQHLVANGASDLLAEALGARGRHARAAVGVPVLPFDAAVEIDAVIAVV